METWETKRFPDGVLEHVSRVISNWLTSPEIERLIRAARFPLGVPVSGAKWKYLYNFLSEMNRRPSGQYGVRRIIETFCDPTRWITQEDNRKTAMNALNAGLVHMGLQLNKDGRFIFTRGKITHPVNAKPSEAKTEPNLMTVSPVFIARDVKTEENLCFVLMPFKDPFDRLYKEKIKPTVESCGCKCLKANDLFSPTPILEDIWTYICKSKIIIADVTGRNPNVFYEIGIAHTVGKPVIIVTQDKDDVPFDVAHLRHFVYSDDALGWDRLCRDITSALKTIMSQDNRS